MKVGNRKDLSLRRRGWLAALVLSAALLLVAGHAPNAWGDEPYARSKDYDLQHSKIALKFDIEKRKVIGDVTHSLAILRDGTVKIWKAPPLGELPPGGER